MPKHMDSEAASPKKHKPYSTDKRPEGKRITPRMTPEQKAAVFAPREKETDAHRIAQRQKQVDFGKNTLGYDYYLKAVPR